MRVMMRSLAAITFVLLGGCAAATTESDLPADHPANPNAAVAPVSPPSNTLRTAAPSAAMSGMAAALYACPMHPEVTSTNPNDRCPRCNMKVNKPVQVPAPAAATQAAPTTDHAGHEAHGGDH
jgi:hypothetical protein